MTSVRLAHGAAPGAALSGPGTRVVLIGTGVHAAGSGLPDVPAVSTTLDDLQQVLVRQCGVADSNVQMLADPLSPLEVGRVLTESAKRAQDVLLVCYVGHGLVSPGGELYLATKSTERQPELLAYTALAYTAVRTSLLQSPARSIVVVLDCCFSGKALGVLGALDDAVAVDLAQVNGGYVLTSAAPEELALAPPGARHTAFTGELIKLLTRGDPAGPPLLTLRHAFQYLNRILPARGFPKPHRRASEWIDDLVLAPNPACHLPGDASPEQDEAGDDVCPYPGLAAFRAEDAQWFFGRERVTNELVGRLAARLQQARPLVLVGASGSGKSSLLRAGLLPALSAGKLLVPGSRAWPHLLLTPSVDPVGELAAQIAHLAGGEPGVVRAELVANPEGFAATVRRALTAWAGGGDISGARVVLIVDQFEETFVRCTEDQDRQVFIRALCAAASTGDGGLGREPPALVILGVRADLYDRCAAYPELLPALQDGPVVLGPMGPAELRVAIERPAAAAGLTLEAGLVETLLRELGAGSGCADTGAGAVSYDPGALPLLSHALQAIWEHRADRTLTVAGYQATGGIRGAVASTAEATFQGLDPAGQHAARRLLLRMVQISDGGPDTRLRADRSTLIAHSPDLAAASAVFDTLVRGRVIMADGDTAEITHEDLLHAWPRLRGWIDADRVGLHVHQQLTEAAQRWDRSGRLAAALYSNTVLKVAQDWAQEPAHYDDLGPLERDFLAASQTLRTRQQQQAIERRERRVRQLLVVLVVLLVFSLAGGGITLYYAQRYPIPITVLTGHTDNVNVVVFSPDGRTLATGSGDNTVRLWNVTDPTHPTPLIPPLDHTSYVTAISFSPDGRTLATGSGDSTVRLWNVTELTHPTPLTDYTSIGRAFTAMAFSPDGRTLVGASIAGSGNKVLLWNVTDPTDPTHPPTVITLTSHTDLINVMVFSPDGRTLAIGSGDSTVRLWNVTDPTHPTALGQSLIGTSNVTSMAFSPDRNTLATATGSWWDSTVRLWNVTDPTHPTALGQSLIGSSNVTSMAFSPDGNTLAGASHKGVSLWNLP